MVWRLTTTTFYTFYVAAGLLVPETKLTFIFRGLVKRVIDGGDRWVGIRDCETFTISERLLNGTDSLVFITTLETTNVGMFHG